MHPNLLDHMEDFVPVYGDIGIKAGEQPGTQEESYFPLKSILDAQHTRNDCPMLSLNTETVMVL